MHVIEVIFKNLLKRKCILPTDKEQDKTAKNKGGKAKATGKEKTNRSYILYNEAWSLLLTHLGGSHKENAAVALKVCMQLILAESKLAKNREWPVERLRSILKSLIESETSPPVALVAFEKYARCLDVLQLCYQQLIDLVPSSLAENPDRSFNLLSLINLLDLGKTVLNEQQHHIGAGTESNPSFNYDQTRKYLNKLWNSIMAASSGLEEKVHRQVLVVLLERILPHLYNPILLTDFLMDSLHQFGKYGDTCGT